MSSRAASLLLALLPCATGCSTAGPEGEWVRARPPGEPASKRALLVVDEGKEEVVTRTARLFLEGEELPLALTPFGEASWTSQVIELGQGKAVRDDLHRTELGGPLLIPLLAGKMTVSLIRFRGGDRIELHVRPPPGGPKSQKVTWDVTRR